MVKSFSKKVILCLLLMIALLNKTYSQNNFPVEPPLIKDTIKNPEIDSGKVWKGLYVNPLASYGKALPYSAPANITAGNTFDLGADVCYWFHPNLGLSVGAQFQQYSFKYSYSNVLAKSGFNNLTPTGSSGQDTTVVAGYGATITYTLDYVRIPILLKFISSHITNVGFYCEAGTSADIVVASNVSGTGTQTEYSFSKSASLPAYDYVSTISNAANISESNADVARFNVDLHVGIGMMVPISKVLSIVVEGAVDYRLLNGGTGANDVISFGNSQYYFYGTGNYGSFNFESLIAKVQFKL